MCWIIAVVSILDHSHCTFFKLLTFPIQSAMTQLIALTWLGIDVSTTVPTFTWSLLTLRLVVHGWEVCGVQGRTICKYARPGLAACLSHAFSC